MNEGFPPLVLAQPEVRRRRSEAGRSAPLPPEVLARRSEIAQILRVKIEDLSQHLRKLSDAERKAIFYKLEHAVPANPQNLSGVGLKPIAQPNPETIYAVPKDDNLDRLLEKLNAFEMSEVRNQHVPHEWLANLLEITAADPRDRLSDDLRNRYDELVTQAWVICEIEFLTLKAGANQQRMEIAGWLSDLRSVFGSGVHGHFFEHELMLPTCRAVIRCDGSTFSRLVEEGRWIERIRWIESRPHFQTYAETLESFRIQDLAPLSAPPADATVICVVDSGVTAGNPFLEGTVKPELAKSFLKHAPDNPNDEHGHGSAVASLAAYYALNLAPGAENVARVWIANARILNASNQIEDERLFSKLIEQVVEHFVRRGVRIFCLAAGDENRIWNDATRRALPRKSWVARKIDQLSRQHDIVFVTCTGNIDIADLTSYSARGLPYPAYFAESESQILDPGQAALAVTVGSIAAATRMIASARGEAIALRNQPSPFTRTGPGIRREIKPELVDYGGNLAYEGEANVIRDNRGLQIPTASRQLSPAISHWTGTSFAAPRAAHRLALIEHELRSLGLTASAPLLRAFLVNSANHREDNGELGAIREAFPVEDRDRLQSILGYGLSDQDRATGCDDYSTILYYRGDIEPDTVMFFDIPVPQALADSNDRQRLTVTVAYAPEVQRWGLERYFGMDLKWRMFRGDKSRDEIVDAMAEPQDESDLEPFDVNDDASAEEASLPKELKFRPTYSVRSRGTIQHATYEWTQHRAEYSDEHYLLAIAAFKRWDRTVQKAPLGVVVRLEDLGRTIPIYGTVRASVLVET